MIKKLNVCVRLSYQNTGATNLVTTGLLFFATVVKSITTESLYHEPGNTHNANGSENINMFPTKFLHRLYT